MARSTPLDAPLLSLAEAVRISGKSISTLRYWLQTGQLKKTEPPPMARKNRTYIHPDDLKRACTEKLVPYKMPRTPSRLRDQALTSREWHTKWKHDEKFVARLKATKKYNRYKQKLLKARANGNS